MQIWNKEILENKKFPSVKCADICAIFKKLDCRTCSKKISKKMLTGNFGYAQFFYFL